MTTPDTAPAEIDDPIHRQAWADYAAGVPVEVIATGAGKSVSTIKRWVKNWRDTYGDDLFVDVRNAANEARTKAATTERHRRWIERSAAIEALLGEVTVSTLSRLAAEVTYEDVTLKDLATIAGILIDKGQLVSGGATARAGGPRGMSQADIDRALDEMVADVADVVGE